MRYGSCSFFFWWAAGMYNLFRLTYNGKRASGAPSRLIPQLATFLQGNCHGYEISSCAASTINCAVFAEERFIKADLSDANKYLACFAGALEYSVSPHFRRPQFADCLGNYNRTYARNWFTKEIEKNLGDSNCCAPKAWGPARMFLRAFSSLGELPVVVVYHSNYGSRMAR